MAKLLTPDEVAQILGISRQSVNTLATHKQIPGIKVGHVWRFLSTDLTDWLRELHNWLDENEEEEKE